MSNPQNDLLEVAKETNRRLAEMNTMFATMNTYLAELAGHQDILLNRSKEPWRNARPTPGLTWNVELSGDEFLNHMSSFSDSLPSADLLEIGPGYGRLVKSLKSGPGFGSYLGVDISEANTSFLGEEYGDEKTEFICLDFMEFEPKKAYDAVMAVAVFQHIYPDIREILQKVRSILKPGGHIFFDVPVGGNRYLEPKKNFFIRHYVPSELRKMLSDEGFEVRGVEDEQFSPERSGVFVCGRAVE